MTIDDPLSEALAVWIVFQHPADFPDKTLARKRLIRPGINLATAEIRIGSLEDLRSQFEREGLFCIARDPSDATSIVETWL